MGGYWPGGGEELGVMGLGGRGVGLVVCCLLLIPSVSDETVCESEKVRVRVRLRESERVRERESERVRVRE